MQAAGNRGYYVPQAKIYHHGAATSGGEFSRLAVRLRTRNSLLLLLKNMPALIFLRCLPMITLAQLSWLLRVLVHWRMGSYLRGLAGALILAPEMIRDRAALRRCWRISRHVFWQRILQSESMARKDFAPLPAEPVSLFLKWYFRWF